MGSFGNWREGRSQTWCSLSESQQTPRQKRDYTDRLQAIHHARRVAKSAEQNAVACKAAAVWAEATPINHAASHGYLLAKGIQPHDTRLIETETLQGLVSNSSPSLFGPLLVIPIRNAVGELRSLQFITEDGTKRPLTGGEKQSCFYLMGGSDSANCAVVLIVCEGFATGASISEATEQTVAVAFDRGNLEPVCRSLRQTLNRPGN